MHRSLDDDELRTEREPREGADRVSQQSRHNPVSGEGRTVYQMCGREYHLNSTQSAVLRDVGSFRTITAESLQKHLYHGDKDCFRKDLRDLTDQRLIEIHPDSAGKSRYVSLTRTGRRSPKHTSVQTKPRRSIRESLRNGNCGMTPPSMSCTTRKRSTLRSQAALQSELCSTLN